MKTLTAIELLNDKRNHLKIIIDANMPYDALQLLSLHIEFMGRLLDRLNPDVSAGWSVNRKHEDPFKKVCTMLSSMSKYNYELLQNQLRNGLVHNGVPTENLLLTHKVTQGLQDSGTFILNVNTIYEDFSMACDDLIALLNKYEKDHPDSLMTDKKFPRLNVGSYNDFQLIL